jgi:hypothetical protein
MNPAYKVESATAVAFCAELLISKIKTKSKTVSYALPKILIARITKR